jgi:UDP-N-acetylmuramate dehydrogenase
MNAGAYEREIRDVLIDAEAVDDGGRVHRADAASLGFGYRHCSAPDDWIFTAARLRAMPDSPGRIAERMSRIAAARKESQPIRTRTGGSTFKNPPGRRAWELIDEAGCRGLLRGGAQVSPMHCNFLINTGTATAADLEGLGEEVRRRVFETSGIELEWEIRRIGVPAGGLEAVS